jgi:transposase
MSADGAASNGLEKSVSELLGIVDHARERALTQDECATLMAVIHMVALLQETLRSKNVSLDKIRNIAFGGETESTRNVLRKKAMKKEDKGEENGDGAAKAKAEDIPSKEPPKDPEKKVEGHGRLGADDYTGATKTRIEHPILKRGDDCPLPGCDGKVYPIRDAVSVHLYATAPVQAHVLRREQLRCNLCNTVFTAPTPDDPMWVMDRKYDPSVAAMLALLCYKAGLPLNMIAYIQAHCGVPLPIGTQYQLLKEPAAALKPLIEEYVRQAANAYLLQHDDTYRKILELTQEQREAILGKDKAADRTGTFTTGIVALMMNGRMIALFFTGPRHAGENLTEVLKHRLPHLPAPILMCDALDRNLPRDIMTILCNCMSHSRRKFVEVAAHFPEQVREVLLKLWDVYKTDGEARDQNLSPQARMELHRKESLPRMLKLRKYLRAQIDTGRVEPNSSLGQAIRYLLKHWRALTNFLRVPGAPIDNNITERALKVAIRHRKNSLFYRTLNGAVVGDGFMSIIHTAELNGIDTLDYLVSLLRHLPQIAASPGDWMPWTYRDTLERMAAETRRLEPAA